MLTEADLAAAVVAYLREDNCEVYQEVTLPGHSDRADIVATKEDQVAVVECKLQLSIDLLAQGKRWSPYANRVLIAVPYARPSEGRTLAFDLCSSIRLGALEVDGDAVRMRTAPWHWGTRLSDNLLDALRPEHKAGYAKAGTQRGQFTPFKGMVEAISAYVAEHPGTSLDDAITGTQQRHLRATTLLRLVRSGKVPGVKQGWKKRLYPEALAPGDAP